jgi:UDP-3-O-[3-hydroxymyristoyl] glucosamine N-acyltransferase
MLTKDIAKALSARLNGDGTIDIRRLVHPDQATHATDLAIAVTADAAAVLARTKADAVVVPARSVPPSGRFKAVIAIEEVRTALAILTSLFDPGPAHAPGIHPTAIISPDAVLGEGTSIGPYTVIGPKSRVGARTAILPHVTVGADVVIGSEGLIHPGVRIGDRVTIGDRVIIHHNAVVGTDGFSFVPELAPRSPYPVSLGPKRVHSLGTVIIGDDVEIGACTTIDRSTLEATRIGNGTKIDNQVHIGHNVTIGQSCLIAGKVGVSGSVTIGDSVLVGGGAGIADHLTIGTGARIAAASAVATNVPEGLSVSGYPAMRHERTLENLQYQARQKALHGKVNDIKLRLEALEQPVKK